MARRIPPLNQLKAFEAAARLGSFRDAGNELNVTHSAVSHQIKALEQYFGSPLFHRRARGVEMTETARDLFGDVTRALDLLADSAEQFKRSALTGKLRISIAPSFASRWLLKRLDGFEAQFPSISVAPEIASDVLDFGQSQIDLAIRHGFGDWPGVEAEKLFDERLWLVSAPRIAQRLEGRDGRLELANTRLLTASVRKDEWAQWLAQTGSGDRETVEFISYPTQALALDGAVSGLGIALADYRLVEDDIREGRLLRLTGFELRSERGFYLVWPRGPVEDAKSVAFRAWLTDELGQLSADSP